MGHNQSKGSSDDSTPHVCSTPNPLVESPTDPIVGGYSFYQFNMILTGACAAFCCLAIFGLMFRHALNYTDPQRQRNIMRICCFLPIYAIGTLIMVCEPNTNAYLKPWLDVAQSIAIANFFILMCSFLAEQGESVRDAMMEPIAHSSGKLTPAGYKRAYFLICLYPIASILIAVVTDITQAANVYCYTSNATYFAHLWLNILKNLTLVTAVMSVLRIYRLLASELKPHRTLQKLLAFKLLVGLQFVQQLVYWILQDINPSPLNPTSTLNYTDIQFGVPNLLSACELVVFAIFFHYAYSVTPYTQRSTDVNRKASDSTTSGRPTAGSPRQGGFLGIKAWIDILNPADLIAAYSVLLGGALSGGGVTPQYDAEMNARPARTYAPIENTRPSYDQSYAYGGAVPAPAVYGNDERSHHHGRYERRYDQQSAAQYGANAPYPGYAAGNQNY